MSCYHPLTAYRTKDGDVTFDSRKADSEFQLPCGQCIGCRVARSRAWALRCVHEASLHPLNCFITLTYSDQNLPPGGSLRYRDFQLFMKRLRKKTGVPMRYFVCGEYGEKLSRPHYHACLFGYDFPDKTSFNTTAQYPTWRSKLLESLWRLGNTHLGSLNYQSAGYTARYCLKKVTGDLAALHYSRIDADGVIHSVAPEFARMSTRPGVGAGWFRKYGNDLARDYVVHDGMKFPVPKYYDRLLKRENPDLLEKFKSDRSEKAYEFREHSTPDRLKTREHVEKSKLKQLKRNIES